MGNERIVLIDDDEDTLEIFTEYMQIRGFDVLATGTNGRDAEVLYKKLRPDVVITDIMMPDFDGFYGIEKIRQENPQAKIIVITADVTEDTKKKLDEIKPTAILFKPYELETVVETIKGLEDGEMVVLSKDN